MRAAAILGLGAAVRDLKPFQNNSSTSWLMGMPGASSDADVVLLFGGDGTLHRHLAQLVRLQLPVLVVPAGSGNDFARALNLRGVKESIGAWEKFLAGGRNVRTIDLGLITPLAGISEARESAGEASAPHNPTGYGVPGVGCYFCCVAGCGLDAEVARHANNFPDWLRGHGGYALSLPLALRSFAAPMLTILSPKSDNEFVDEFVVRCSKPTVLVACANSPVYGSGMKIAPRAQMDDGQLDICHISKMNKFKLFCLFPTVYFGGHLRLDTVEYFQAQRLRLQTEHPLDIYADGEYVCQTPVEIAIAPGVLQVVVP
jgi:diacylglycerol kinase (ATP)